MTKKEKDSRDAGREAVRLSKDLPELKENYRKALENSKYGTRATSFKATELDIAKNTLINALIKTGHSQSEIAKILSDISGVVLSAKVSHSMSRDEFYAAVTDYKNALKQHGTLGMKWGIRRYQNPDGSLTALGKKRLEDGSGRTEKAIAKFQQKKEEAIAKGNRKFFEKNIDYMSNYDIQRMSERIKARNTMSELRKQASTISADKFKTWMNTASVVTQTAANMADSGVRLYNTVCKINNTFSTKKMTPIKEGGDKEDQWVKKTISYEEDGKKIVETRNEKIK